MSFMRWKDGSCRQGGLTHNPSDHKHLRITTPMVGVVVSVFKADDARNTDSGLGTRVSSAHQARVQILNDGTDAPMTLPNVIILPQGGSGHDDYYEELPRGTTATIDGSPLNTNGQDVPTWKMNGDWCVVHFIGGSIHQPVMLNWFPHPANLKDPAQGTRNQGRRLARRFAGTRLVVTSQGTIIVDTGEANSTLDNNRITRSESDNGGDILVNVKNNKQLSLDFNPYTYDVDARGNPEEPDFLWSDRTPKTRDDTATRLLADKDFIRLLAGKVAEINGSEKVVLGEEATATENFVMGQAWKSMMESLINAVLQATYPTGVGPSGTINPPQKEILENIRDSLDDQLSKWIFGQEDPP